MKEHNTIGVKEGEEKKCRFCGTKKGGLMVHSGKKDKTTYYSCRPCQSKNKRIWYYRNPENKLKQQEYNRRYLLKLKQK